VIAAGGIDQLHRDAQLFTGLANATLHHRRDSELPPNLSDIHAGVAKPERAASARDAQACDSIECVDQLLRHALAEVALVPFRTHVREGQHRDRCKFR
jgi:hypothetical protein